MNRKILFISVLFFLFLQQGFAQSAKIVGVISDENKQPVGNATISCQGKSSTSNDDGSFIIIVPANQEISVVFTHLSFKSVTLSLELKSNEIFVINPVMSSESESLGEVIVINNRKRIQGITTLEPETIKRIPGLSPGAENVLKLMAGVNSNSDMSSQYSVRGGNYDENLVYVNEIEVYRPFLVRSGQQEGLSFTNIDMTQNVDFSAGGFQAKFGDKMSSVLDITYRRPKSFGASMEASLLGGSLSVDLASKDTVWTAITGVRYRDNSLFVNSQETETNFRPSFADVQSYITFTPNKHWSHGLLGNVSQNTYKYQPLTRQTNFGTLSDPIALQIFYEGQENDKFRTFFGAWKTVFSPDKQNNYRFIASAFQTREQEYFDIDAAYFLGEVDSNIGSETFGDVTFNRAIGSQLNHARNDLDALIVNAEVKGTHNLRNAALQIDWGAKFTHEDIRDRIVEWEVIDSAGFSINPPIIDLPVNDQPYNPYVGPLVPYNNVRATNFVTINRISGFVQFNARRRLGNADLHINGGIRAHNWVVSGDNFSGGKSQTVFSPRLQLSLKPDWQRDVVFRFSTGWYYQPPSYRELRNEEGVVNPNVKAQQSIHFVLSGDYNFRMWDSKFKYVAEAYYKSMDDINTYTLENVRIRYRANNNAEAYAYGLDMRLHGEFVKGTESWFSVGYMKTEENQDDRGFIARPTDQRLKFGILFQDYMPAIPNMKVYMNLVYNTGLPGGSPSYADVYQYQSRLRDYRRADVGFFYVLTEKNKDRPQGHWLKKFQDLAVGFEIFNLFNNQNAITNTWVRDAYTKSQYGIPNYMTTRVFNVKLTARL